MNALSLQNIAFTQRRRLLLNDVGFAVGRRETLALFDLDPERKSAQALLRIAAGLLRPHSGAVLFEDRAFEHRAFAAKPNGLAVGVADGPAPASRLSAFRFLAQPLRRARLAPDLIHRRIGEIALRFGVDTLLDLPLRKLSVQARLRIGLAQALVERPDIVVFDDPLDDPRIDAQERFNLLIALRRLLSQSPGVTLYATADPQTAMTVADRVAILDDGAVAQIATPLYIYDRPYNLRIADSFAAAPINLFEAEAGIDGEGVYAKLSGIRLRLPEQGVSLIGRNTLIGIRPEKLKPADFSRPNAIPVRIRSQAPINETRTLFGWTRCKQAIRIQLPLDAPRPIDPQGDGEASFAVDVDDIAIFDRNGLRLESHNEDNRYVDWIAEEIAATT